MNAAAYARYSTDLQTENSIAYQLDAISAYCRDHDITITAVFRDEGESGTNMDREGFRQLLAAARRHEFDAVVIYDISRGSRDVGDWFTFRKEMMLANIQVISATQKLGDLTNGNDFLLELLTVGMGQREVLETRAKSRAGVAVRAKEGVFLGGIPPLGYDIVNGRYVVNEEEARAVRTIFRMYGAGESYKAILAALQDVRGKRGHPLGKNSLHSILENERYIGTYFWNKKQYKILRKWAGGRPNPDAVRLEGVIPPLVDMETWQRVQKRLHDSRRNAANCATRRSYLLSGMIRCEKCGSMYVGHTTRNMKGYESACYCCGTKYQSHTCDGKNVSAPELEAFVVENLKKFLLSVDYDAVAAEVARRVNGAGHDLRREKAELADVETKIRNGMKYILAGDDFPELAEELKKLRTRKAELENQIAHAAEPRRTVDPGKIAQMLRSSANQLESADPRRIRAVAEKYVQNICAHADGTVSVNIGAHMDGCGGPLLSICVIFIPKKLRSQFSS